MKRALILVGVVLLTFLSVAPVGAQTPAADDEYVPTPSLVTVNPDGSVTVTGECPAADEISYEVRRGNSTRGQLEASDTVETDADDGFTFTTVPLANGQHTITITCGPYTEVLRVNVNRGQGGGAVGSPGTGRLQSAPQVLGDSVSGEATASAGLPSAGSEAGAALDAKVLGASTSRNATASAGLPRTGSDSLPLAQLGVGLVAFGGVALYAAKKRRGDPRSLVG